MYEWDRDTVQRFDQFLLSEEQRRAADARTAEVGDTVETPDGRHWLVVRCAPSDLVDLQKDDTTLSVPREFVRVVAKAGQEMADHVESVVVEKAIDERSVEEKEGKAQSV